MIVFFITLGLIIFLLLVSYFWQKEQRNSLPDDPNYVEPTEVAEEEE
jgi:hypothetical protein